MTTDDARNITPNDGGPAFPTPDSHHPFMHGTIDGAPGMSKRDFFAAQVITGALVGRPPEYIHHPANCEMIARAAYGIADAMLAVRQERGRG